MKQPSYMTNCVSCNRWTSKAYAKAHNGECKGCAEGRGVNVSKNRHSSSRDEGFREDHMGCSADVIEGRADHYSAMERIPYDNEDL